MGLEKILKLGNQELYKASEILEREEIPQFRNIIDYLFTLIREFRAKYGAGRGIAAPQIGVHKRIICLDIENKQHILINPVLSDCSEDMMELWDDCMSFPDLFVKVKRYKTCTLEFKDENWNSHKWELEGDLSELLQHEYDHLNGILATQRALDDKSFRLRE